MAVFRYRYAAGDPPAPSVLLNLAHPLTSVALRDVAAQVDTGADQSVLPAVVADALGLTRLDAERVIGFDGTPVDVPTARVFLQVRDLPQLDVEVLVSDHVTDAVLGRDVLNQYTLTLDGPAGLLTITDD